MMKMLVFLFVGKLAAADDAAALAALSTSSPPEPAALRSTAALWKPGAGGEGAALLTSSFPEAAALRGAATCYRLYHSSKKHISDAVDSLEVSENFPRVGTVVGKQAQIR